MLTIREDAVCVLNFYTAGEFLDPPYKPVEADHAAKRLAEHVLRTTDDEALLARSAEKQ